MMQSALVGALAQELVKDVAAAIQEQGQYAVQFRSQLEELQEQMTFMKSFVVDASKVKDNKETVKTTIASIQELIYEADDLVLDCQIREDYQKKKGRRCFLSPSEISFRLETGKKLAQINCRLRRMRENLSCYYGPTTAHQRGENRPGGGRFSTKVFNRSEIVGLEKDAERIMNWLINEREPLLLVAIVGLAGLGKTTLAKMIFDDPFVEKGLVKEIAYKKKIWVSVSQPVNEVEILQSMLKQLGERDCASSKSDMLTKISELLQDDTYLIVLDDVWSVDEGWWISLVEAMPRNKNCVLITSRNIAVVKKMGVDDERIHNPGLLNEGESWKLFCRVARISANGEQKSLEGVGKEIVNKCGGLPLAIKTIGGLLSLEQRKSVNEWRKISDNFHAKLTEGGNNSEGSVSVIASLKLSYDELPDFLKPCLLCFSIYPGDHVIDVEQLIHWWAGEGFVRSNAEETATATELALNYLSELNNRCLVEVRRNFDGSVYTCKVHDMVRDLTIKVARDEGFCSITNNSSRRLGVASHTKFQDLRGYSKLRALLLTATDEIAFHRDIGLPKVHSLRVLDLSKVKLKSINQKDLWEWITSLKRLACLSLREVEELYELPISIAKLWGLQLLILEKCKNLKNFPISIVKLPRLIFLNVSKCPNLRSLPQGFSKLSNLQELYGFKVAGSGNSTGSCLGELEYLSQLRVLQIEITEESRIQDQELQVLAKLEKLKQLSINAGNRQGSQDDDILTKLDKLSPPPSIEELRLKNYRGETMPGWINPSLLNRLQYLCLEQTRVKNMSKDFWGGAEFESANEVCKWGVEVLSLKFCDRLELSWGEVEKGMPELRYLEVCQCTLLKDFPCNVKVTDSWSRQDDNKDATPMILATVAILSS